MKLEDRTIVITGASRGIGREWAFQLHAQHARVIATARNPDTIASMEADGIRVLPLDVNDPASCDALAKTLGNDPVDLLINNAGIFGPQDQTWDTVDLEAVESIYRTNVVGTLRVTRALKPALLRGTDPWVVNVSSGVGSIAGNERGTIVGYRMSKTAVNMLTKTLSIDEPRIHFAAVHPGWVQTAMGGPEAEWSPPEAVAQLVDRLRDFDAEANGRFFHLDGSELPW